MSSYQSSPQVRHPSSELVLVDGHSLLPAQRAQDLVHIVCLSMLMLMAPDIPIEGRSGLCRFEWQVGLVSLHFLKTAS